MPLSPLTPELVRTLSDRLPEGRVSAPEAGYLTEPRGRYHGASTALVRPATTEEVAAVIRFAGEHRLGVIPYAGGTGLVSGQVAGGAPTLLLSVERLNSIISVSAEENVAVVGAGAILADVRAAAAEADRLFPLSLASEGSARIGGLLSTNAGGVQVLRYGNARELCLGIEAVLPDGEIYHGLKRLRKDNAGYDLRNLLIGAEGTLGVITAACLRLFPQPRQVATALVAVATPGQALALLGRLRGQLGDTLTGYELMHRQGFDFLAEKLPETPLAFEQVPDWAVLVEVSSGTGGQLSDEMEEVLGDGMERGGILDALIAQNAAQAASFWAIRERIPEANRLIGAVASHDISVPVARVPEFIEQARGVVLAIDDSFRINCFGHLGDGNLHYNVFPAASRARSDYDGKRGAVTEAIHDMVHNFDGSISAEHGIGRLKVADLERYGDPALLGAMRAIKRALDPEGIMNPGAVLA